MPRRVLFALCFVCTAVCYAQNRSKLSVYVPLPEGGTAEQKEYFQTNFKMELVGANYPSVDTRAESAYTLLLSIQDNPDFEPTATVDGATSWDENQLKPFELGIKLIHSDNGEEVVSFTFLFDQFESMNEWNLYLLYQALANAYVDDGAPAAAYMLRETDDRWRNQTFYLNTGGGMDFAFYLRESDGTMGSGCFMPTFLAGLEWHFLNFLSAEADFKARLLENGDNYVFTLAGALAVKWVLKFGEVMLEPYAGIEGAFTLDTPVPPLSVIGGIQLGFRGAPRSAWVLDAGVTRNLFGSFTDFLGEKHNVLRVHLLVGFKFGFKDRESKEEAASAP
jgi:hypothetical protein